jgi:hypothetical protein
VVHYQGQTGVDKGDRLFLTTQPGWAFATLAELRRRGVEQYAAFFHRDSSVVVGADERLLREGLLTPGEAYGCLAVGEASRKRDATELLGQQLEPDAVRRRLAAWHGRASSRHGGHGTTYFSVGSEVWGNTAVHRRALAGLVGEALRRALPYWREVPSGGVRFLCKADTEAAVVGLRLYSNVSQREGRPGTLREHLACALLVLAGVGREDAVLDPFMGSGTILRAAWRRFGVRSCIGYEIDAAAYRLAKRAVLAPNVQLHHRSFEVCAPDRLPVGVRLVSNLPFGERFAEVPTDRLLRFLAAVQDVAGAMTLLMGRAQAERVAPALRLRTKNVLVLGQPAAIVYSPS